MPPAVPVLHDQRAAHVDYSDIQKMTKVNELYDECKGMMEVLGTDQGMWSEGYRMGYTSLITIQKNMGTHTLEDNVRVLVKLKDTLNKYISSRPRYMLDTPYNVGGVVIRNNKMFIPRDTYDDVVHNDFDLSEAVDAGTSIRYIRGPDGAYGVIRGMPTYDEEVNTLGLGGYEARMNSPMPNQAPVVPPTVRAARQYAPRPGPGTPLRGIQRGFGTPSRREASLTDGHYSPGPAMRRRERSPEPDDEVIPETPMDDDA